jgi:hypothetical protein
MAALGNTPLSQAQITHQAPFSQQIKGQAKMDADLRRREFREGTKELCDAVITAAAELDTSDPMTLTEFHMFPKLPTELRLKICRSFVCRAPISGLFSLEYPGVFYLPSAKLHSIQNEY